jgi:hypothetical protein
MRPGGVALITCYAIICSVSLDRLGAYRMSVQPRGSPMTRAGSRAGRAYVLLCLNAKMHGLPTMRSRRAIREA